MINLCIFYGLLATSALWAPVDCDQNILQQHVESERPEALSALMPDTVFTTKLDSKPGPEEFFEAGSKSTTFPFIEAIVQRTVNEYMRVIRTERNWLERILHLVREERVIRSRYNCSTDACIYKIQLFTRLLPPYLFQPKPTARRRVRRSFTMESDTLTTPPNDPPLRPASSLNAVPSAEVSLRRANRSVNDAASVVQDDALRLPDNSQYSKSNGTSSKHVSGAGILADINNPVAQPSSFGDSPKIKLERVSQEVLSEALSRETKLLNVKTPVAQEEQDLPHKQTESSVAPSVVTDVEQDPKQSLSESELVLESNTDAFSRVKKEATIPAIQTDENQRESLPMEHLEMAEVTLQDTSELPEITEATTKEQVLLKQNSIEEVQPEDSIQNMAKPTDPEPPKYAVQEAIPFGLNHFAEQPYENCTGRNQHYCYNALKCLYISVLETAVCYCRTGYTGVRCDMFNLPQTLDILKSVQEEMVDFPSLHKRSADTLYGVVEATARYTVNAVIEEDLLSGWDDGIP